ncbi:CRE-CDL-1 protein [Aphelenchoides avenae]|nr:CRE-CDL-1 protein [Aphelenchus avenae]
MFFTQTTLLAIAMDRYSAIRRPCRYSHHVVKERLLILLASWLISASFFIWLAFYDLPPTSCTQCSVGAATTTLFLLVWAATCVVNASFIVGYYTRAAMLLKKNVDTAVRTRSPLLLKLRVHQRAFLVITLIVLSYIVFWCIPLLTSVAALMLNASDAILGYLSIALGICEGLNSVFGVLVYVPSAASSFSLSFDALEELKNKSWLEMADEDEERYNSFTSSKEVAVSVKEKVVVESIADDLPDAEEVPTLSAEQAGASSRKSSRKAAEPKKSDIRPKFERSLASAERRSERIRSKDEDKNKREKKTGEAEVVSSVRHERKRRLSNDSMATVDDGESPRKRIPNKSLRGCETPDGRGARRNVFNSSLPIFSPRPKEDYMDPKLGWCEDEATLRRRTKEIEKAKEKAVYKRYLSEVPKFNRDKATMPMTPNKYIKYSRRSWDAQVRKWKKSLYEWAGEEPSPSVNTSYAGSECGDDMETETLKTPSKENTTNKLLEDVKIQLANPDNLASMLGHFDVNTRQYTNISHDDESTLKAVVTGKERGPTDFSVLKQHM